MHLIKANTLNTETSALHFYDALQFTVFIYIYSLICMFQQSAEIHNVSILLLKK